MKGLNKIALGILLMMVTTRRLRVVVSRLVASMSIVAKRRKHVLVLLVGVFVYLVVGGALVFV